MEQEAAAAAVAALLAWVWARVRTMMSPPQELSVIWIQWVGFWRNGSCLEIEMSQFEFLWVAWAAQVARVLQVAWAVLALQVAWAAWAAWAALHLVSQTAWAALHLVSQMAWVAWVALHLVSQTAWAAWVALYLVPQMAWAAWAAWAALHLVPQMAWAAWAALHLVPQTAWAAWTALHLVPQTAWAAWAVLHLILQVAWAVLRTDISSWFVLLQPFSLASNQVVHLACLLSRLPGESIQFSVEVEVRAEVEVWSEALHLQSLTPPLIAVARLSSVSCPWSVRVDEKVHLDQ